MIVRSWRGETTAANADEYAAHLRRAVLPELNGLDGFLGMYVLRRALSTGIEFRVLTLWESLRHVEAFAGEDTDAAVVPPAARALLQRLDEVVHHYDVLEAPESVRSRA